MYLVQSGGIHSLVIFDSQGWIQCKATGSVCPSRGVQPSLTYQDWYNHIHAVGYEAWNNYSNRVRWWREEYLFDVTKYCECCGQHEVAV